MRSYIADEVLQVNVSIDKAEVSKGEPVTYTCTWNLDSEYSKLLMSRYIIHFNDEESERNGQYSGAGINFELLLCW